MPGIDAYTTLMLHCNGADGSTTFTDSSSYSNTINRIGNPTIETDNYKFGGASGFFNNNNSNYLSLSSPTGFDFGTNSFTIDFWVYNISAKDAGYLYTHGGVSGEGNFFLQRYSSDNTLLLGMYGSSVHYADNYITGQWQHIALVRNGNKVLLFIDGVKKIDFTYAETSTDIGEDKTIGGGNGLSAINGYIDEFRVSKGIARWVSNFIPPTQQYDDTIISVSKPFPILRGRSRTLFNPISEREN